MRYGLNSEHFPLITPLVVPYIIPFKEFSLQLIYIYICAYLIRIFYSDCMGDRIMDRHMEENRNQ